MGKRGSGGVRRRMRTAVPMLLLLSGRNAIFANSATWNLDPGTNVWNTDSNWTPATGHPNGPADTATFGLSNTTSVTLSAPFATTQVAGIIFNPGASSFSFEVIPLQQLTISGTGITNNSAVTQSFETESFGNQIGQIALTNSATAGSNTSFTNEPGTNAGAAGSTQFFNSSNAGSATITNNGGASTGNSGRTRFFDTSTAVNATITNHCGVAVGASGAFTEFFGTSSAGSATITNRGTSASGAASGSTTFGGSATAANAAINNNGATVSGSGGVARFRDTSTAGSATFSNNAGTASGAAGGAMLFSNTATAGSASITNHGAAVAGAGSGSIFFGEGSSAGGATVINNAAMVAGAGAGSTQFASTATADSATLIANGGAGNGGSIQFFENSTGGTASLDVRNNGTGTPGSLDISFHNAPGVTIGSLEGSGNVFLGARVLTVGSNNLSKTFSGVIQDGGPGGGTGGSLSKTGTGALTLTGSNTYSGATAVAAGKLALASNLTNSSAVSVTGGTLELTEGGGSNRVIRTLSVSVTGSGKIDLKDNKLITQSDIGTWSGSEYTGIAGLVDAGRGNAGNALWDGVGIVTSDTRAINNGDLVSIGVVKVGDFKSIADTASTTFAGQTVFGSDTVAMVTWGGDANLDGKINIDDYGRIDGNVGQSGSVFGWSRGDFNYDGKINIDDYGIIDGNINRQGTPFAAAGGLEAVAAVPEPFLSLWLAPVLLAGRRRRSG